MTLPLDAAPCPSVAQVWQAIEWHISTKRPTESAARQLRWTGRLLANAVGLGLTPEAEENTAELMGPDAMAQFWQLARSGQASGRTKPLEDPSMRAIGHALDIIAGSLGIEGFTRPPSPGRSPLRRVVPRPSRHELRDRLAREVDAGSRDAARARFLAMVGVILDTGARNKELSVMETGDLAGDLSMLDVHRYPQAYTGEGPEKIVKIRLSEPTRAALLRWIDFREPLAQSVQGTPTRRLWVSLKAHHAGRPKVDGQTVCYPAGWPLQTRGIARALAYMDLPPITGPDGQRELSNLEQLCRAVRSEDARALGTRRSPRKAPAAA